MKKSVSNISPSAFCFLLSVLCLLFSSWLMFHTFSYDKEAQLIEIAGKCWSDFGAHIPMIRSFSMGGNFDRLLHFQMPEYPIFPGAPIRYHFIFYMIVGLLEKIGIRIDWALNVPSIIGFSGLLILIGVISYKLFKNYAVAILSVLFFLFNGALSFLKFFEKNPLSSHTFTDIVTNRTFSSFGPWDGGLVSAFWNLNIYTNQRHLAAGFALGLGFIALCLFLEKKSWKQQLPYLLITVPLLSLLPYFHQPMLIIIVAFMIWYFFIMKKIRIFLLLTGIISVGPILLQLLSFSTDSSTFSWYPGYLIYGTLTPGNFLQYWFYNLGLHIILIPIGFLIAPLKIKKVVFPIFMLFIIANCFKFSVEIAANHKFFNFFMIFGNMMSAYVIVKLWQAITMGDARRGTTVEHPQSRNVLKKTLYNLEKIFMWSKDAQKHIEVERDEDVGRGKTRGGTQQIIGIIIMAILLLSLTLSGIIDFFAVANDSKIPFVDIPRNEIATWIEGHTPTDAVILNTSYLYNPASIAGRSIFLGWPYFPWSAGYKENRMPVMKEMYESKDPNVYCPLFKKYNISYVTVEAVSGNPDLPTIAPSYFRSVATPVFSGNNGEYAIYTTHSLCIN